MSRPAKVGGIVQISYKQYDVLERNEKDHQWCWLMVRSKETQSAYWARSEQWRSWCGPWKIVGPVVDGEPHPEDGETA